MALADEMLHQAAVAGAATQFAGGLRRTELHSPILSNTRDAVLQKGITINGLPIMVKEPSYSTMDIDNLDLYYEDCVIGGQGSFVVTIKNRDKFKEAIRSKLILEVADRTPEPGIRSLGCEVDDLSRSLQSPAEHEEG